MLLAETLAAAEFARAARAQRTDAAAVTAVNTALHCRAYNVIAKTRGQLHAVFIITEYAAGGDLLKLLLRPDTPLGWKVKAATMYTAALMILILMHSVVMYSYYSR